MSNAAGIVAEFDDPLKSGQFRCCTGSVLMEPNCVVFIDNLHEMKSQVAICRVSTWLFAGMIEIL
jgi:hypothetical protein